MFESILASIFERTLLFTGILIISTVGIGTCGMILIMSFAGLRALSAMLPPSPILRDLGKFVLQCIRVLIECLPIVILGVFFGASIGTAIKVMLHFTAAPLNGVVIGGILSGLLSFALITPKWGHCYLGKHDYDQEPQCVLCGKNLD